MAQAIHLLLRFQQMDDQSCAYQGLKCIASNGRVADNPDLHMARQAIVHNQAVRHLHPVGLHGVPRPIVVVSYLRVIKVGHLGSGNGGHDMPIAVIAFMQGNCQAGMSLRKRSVLFQSLFGAVSSCYMPYL